MRFTFFSILMLQIGIFSAYAARAEAVKISANAEDPGHFISLLHANKNEVIATSISPTYYSPHEIVKMFLAAVKKGELVVFNQLLDKSMITPVRVEYIYEIISKKTSRKVYSELNAQIIVPGQDCCLVRGVAAILDESGHIAETEIHLFQKK